MLFGLRHGLDADHIAAIDNVTRRLVDAVLNEEPSTRRPPSTRPPGQSNPSYSSLELGSPEERVERPVNGVSDRVPVTIGLWFAMGHSSVVLLVVVVVLLGVIPGIQAVVVKIGNPHRLRRCRRV